LTPNLNSNSAAALAGGPRAPDARVAEAAPSRPCGLFSLLLPPGRFIAHAAQFRSNRCHSQARTGGRRLAIFPGDETISGTRETILKHRRCRFLSNDRAQRRQEAHMNHSIHSADRSTHLKIVVLALVAGVVVAGLGISARSNSDYTQTAHVIKAGKPVVVTSSDASVVR
jgi:hypothetical protein